MPGNNRIAKLVIGGVIVVASIIAAAALIVFGPPETGPYALTILIGGTSAGTVIAVT